jgi:hypothetical protein
MPLRKSPPSDVDGGRPVTTALVCGAGGGGGASRRAWSVERVVEGGDALLAGGSEWGILAIGETDDEAEGFDEECDDGIDDERHDEAEGFDEECDDVIDDECHDVAEEWTMEETMERSITTMNAMRRRMMVESTMGGEHAHGRSQPLSKRFANVM